MSSRHARRRRRSYGNPLLVFALLIGGMGFVLGLAYAWFINPVQYVDVEPAQLAEEQQRTYLILISLTYASDGDLGRAQARLRTLGLQDDAGTRLAEVADEAATLGLADHSVRALANLALALGGQPGPALAFAGTIQPPPTLPDAFAITPFAPTPTPVSPTPTVPTETPTLATDQPTPTLTPTPPRSQYVIADGTTVCDEDQTPGLLVIIVQGEEGEERPGVELRAEWEDGQDRFFTGLKPEESPGYADFLMTEGETYRVQVVDEDGDPASDLSGEITPGQCLPAAGGDPQLEGYELVFREQ